MPHGDVTAPTTSGSVDRLSLGQEQARGVDPSFPGFLGVMGPNPCACFELAPSAVGRCAGYVCFSEE